jgi:hypothetical protein
VEEYMSSIVDALLTKLIMTMEASEDCFRMIVFKNSPYYSANNELVFLNL